MHFRTKLCLQPRPRVREDINNNQLLDDNHTKKGNKEQLKTNPYDCAIGNKEPLETNKQIRMIVLLIMTIMQKGKQRAIGNKSL